MQYMVIAHFPFPHPPPSAAAPTHVPTMTSKKKEVNPETKECANCLAPEGRHGVTLKACIRCKATHYCGRACQTAHWKAGHKQFCVTPEERMPSKPPPMPPPSEARAFGPRPEDPRSELGGANECAICLDPLNSGTVCTLPCTHTFHAQCVIGLRAFGIKQVCPMCRVELPPGPEQLFEEAMRRYSDLQRKVDIGMVTWGSLTKMQKKETKVVIEMLHSAADQGLAGAQNNLGCMNKSGGGVKQDYGEAMRWFQKAAEQGDADAQNNLGRMFDSGDGEARPY